MNHAIIVVKYKAKANKKIYEPYAKCWLDASIDEAPALLYEPCNYCREVQGKGEQRKEPYLAYGS